MTAASTRRSRETKLEERDKLILEAETELGLADKHPGDIVFLQTSPEQIVHNLKLRKEGWRVENVVSAYIRAACAAHRRTNCLTEVMFRDALDTARLLDKQLASGQEPEGEFWGLPASFKDNFNIVGVDSSLGCSPYCSQPITDPTAEATLLKLFRRAGGIPFCKTNVPQTLLAFECRNPIFGGTSNPYSPAHTCGGSSGGEAALVALNGTPLGWGSDIGGSLRIPAHYSGCCALKPVRGRIPIGGVRTTVPGFEGLLAAVGPMARTVEDLRFASKAMITMALIEQHPSGERLLPIPWREVSLQPKLKIGYWSDHEGFKTSPACTRAVEMVVKALRAAGHEVVPFDPLPIKDALKLLVALTSSDGYKTLLQNIGPDPMEPSMQLVTLGTRIPRLIQRLACWLIGGLLADQEFASIFTESRRKTVSEYWHWTHERNIYAADFTTRAWEENELDFLICPVQAVPAVEHGRTKLLSPLAMDTILFNVVDSTVGVLPVTRVDPELDALPADFLKGSKGSWILESRVYAGADPAYNAQTMAGLPVGVQIVGRAWEEEKVLACMAMIEKMIEYK